MAKVQVMSESTNRNRGQLSLIFCCVYFIVACTTDTYHFVSPEEEYEITIKTDGDIRYIIAGSHYRVPDSNYVKIDLSKVDRGAGDEIVGCWNRDGVDWIIMMDKASVIENKLDTAKYLFKDHFPVDHRNIPTLKGYKESNCFSVDFNYRFLRRTEGAIMEK